MLLKHPRAAGAALVTVAVGLVGCGVASPAANTEVTSTTVTDTPSTTITDTPSTTAAATTSAPTSTTTLEPTTTTASTPMSTLALPDDMPSKLYACGVDGVPIYEISRAGDDWEVTDQFDLPGRDGTPRTPEENVVGRIVVGADGLYVSTCCAPAAGITWRYAGGAAENLGLGVVTDAVRDVKVTTHGGLHVEVSSSSGVVDLAGPETPGVLDAALSPKGGVAVLTMDQNDIRRVYWIPVPVAGALGDAEPLYESDTRLDSIAVDRDSKIWIGSAEEPELVIVDTAGGGVETEALEHTIVDLASDASGAYLLITTGDGRLTARRFDEPTYIEVPSPEVDRADW